MQLNSKPRGARGIEPKTFTRRGQLLSRPPTIGPAFLIFSNYPYDDAPSTHNFQFHLRQTLRLIMESFDNLALCVRESL